MGDYIKNDDRFKAVVGLGKGLYAITYCGSFLKGVNEWSEVKVSSEKIIKATHILADDGQLIIGGYSFNEKDEKYEKGNFLYLYGGVSKIFENIRAPE